MHDEKEKLTEKMVKHMIGRLCVIANRSLLKHKENPEDEFRSGHTLAYFEVLKSIQIDLLNAGQDLSEFGLNINLGRKFL